MTKNKQQSLAFVLADQQPVERVQEGIKRQIMGHGPELMVVKVWFDEGAEGYQHQHRHSQVSYVESGEFMATIDGKSERLSAGDSFYVEPNKMHGAVCLKAGVLIDVFSPQREDFLEE